MRSSTPTKHRHIATETGGCFLARFCLNGCFSYWNDKLTTPPLIYIIASLTGFCHRERYLNSAIIPLTFVGLTRLRLLSTNGHNNFKDAILCSIAILSLPVLFGTNLLFYTDLLSLTLVVYGLGTQAPTPAALIFTLSVFSRQTNIIWGAFYCLQNLQNDFDSKRPYHSTVTCVLKHWAFGVLGIGFIVFFIKNDFSIVLGDSEFPTSILFYSILFDIWKDCLSVLESAHQLHLHIPQLFYFSCFALASSIPIFLHHSRLVLAHIKRNSLLYILMGFLMIPCVYLFSYTHLYLLSDNRHFTFYIWRRWFLKNSLLKFISIPFYLLSLGYLYVTMRHLRWPVLLGGFLSICFVLIPAHLVEFRYFILPFALWRLKVRKTSLQKTVLEIFIHMAVNFVTLWLFFNRPFVWENEPDKLQRFMW